MSTEGQRESTLVVGAVFSSGSLIDILTYIVLLPFSMNFVPTTVPAKNAMDAFFMRKGAAEAIFDFIPSVEILDTCPWSWHGPSLPDLSSCRHNPNPQSNVDSR